MGDPPDADDLDNLLGADGTLLDIRRGRTRIDGEAWLDFDGIRFPLSGTLDLTKPKTVEQRYADDKDFGQF